MIDYDIVSANIRRLLKKKGISQRQLAEISGLGRNTICGYCTNRIYPTSKALQDMAYALETEVGEFFKGIEYVK